MGVLDTWGGIQTHGGVQTGGPLHPPITCRYPLEQTDAQGSIGTYEGCLNIWGHWGVSEHTGVSACTGGV